VAKLTTRVRRLEARERAAAACRPDADASEQARAKLERLVELYPPQDPPPPNASLAERVGASIAAHAELQTFFARWAESGSHAARQVGKKLLTLAHVLPSQLVHVGNGRDGGTSLDA